MQTPFCTPGGAHGPAAALRDVELHDHLLVAGSDLDRLRALLGDACAALARGFHAALAEIEAAQAQTQARAGDAGLASSLERALGHLHGAVTGLQFDDLASQLVGHTQRRLRACAERLAADAFGADACASDAEEAPSRPNPVAQSVMSSGSIELF